MISGLRLCNVVNQYCERPANLDVSDPEDLAEILKNPLKECFRCGLDVCKNCSSRRKYLRYGVVLLCDYCQEEEDGTPWNVVRRAAVKAGYTRQQSLKYANEYDTPKEAKRKKDEEHKKFLAWLRKEQEKCPSCDGTGVVINGTGKKSISLRKKRRNT